MHIYVNCKFLKKLKRKMQRNSWGSLKKFLASVQGCEVFRGSENSCGEVFCAVMGVFDIEVKN